MIAALHLSCALLLGVSTAVLLQVDGVLEAAMAHQHLPGLSVAIARNGKLIYARGYGHRIVPKRLPADGHTVYNIASTSKQFTAAAIVRLAQRGAIHLDDKLGKYYTGYRYADRVTIRQLLNHTSGIPDYTDIPSVPPTATVAQEMAAIAKLPLEFLPGTRFEYSNSNYEILGLIVEKLTHEPLDRALAQYFFKPLGMRGSASGVGPWTLSGGAMGYAYRDGRFVAIPLPVYGHGDGGVDSSAADLMTWDQALISGRVVSPESLREMTTPPGGPDGETTPGGYGFGLQVATLFGHREFEHGGDNEGFHNDNAVFPDDKFSIAILSNGNNFFYEYLLVKLFTLFYPPTAQQQAALDRGVPGQDAAVTARAVAVLRRMQEGRIKKSEILAPAIVSALPGTPQQIATRAGAVGRLKTAVFRGLSYRGGNRIYEYWLYFPNSVVGYFFVLTPRGSVYAAMPVRAD